MERLYILDPQKYIEKGYINNTATRSDIGIYVDYMDKPTTFEQYKIQKNQPDLVALNWEDFDIQFNQPYLLSLQGNWEECSEEHYWDMLECLPPMRWTQGIISFFFISEAYTHDLHTCIIKDSRDKNNVKYYEATRSRYKKNNELIEDFILQIKK